MSTQLAQSSLDTRERFFCTWNKTEARSPLSQQTVYFPESTSLSSLPTVGKQRGGGRVEGWRWGEGGNVILFSQLSARAREVPSTILEG